ncbi:MAG: hypothetical protein H7Z16_07420 [Pyrinomonadaceae bacterium]|nr:hypothetical protein [Pyrinomonadaceae bacterium]
MKLDAKELALIRKYLLGRSPQEECTNIEQRLLADSDYFQEILIGEEELTDEYVAEQLSESDRQAFETNFLVTVERQRRVSFARRWSKYIGEATKTAVEEEIVTQPSELSADSDDSVVSPVSTVSTVFPVFPVSPQRRRFFSFFPAQTPILSYSLAAAVLLGVVSLSWVVVRNWRSPQTGGSALAVTLTPGLTRDGGEITRIRLSPGLDSVDLRLTLPKSDYREKSDYRVYRSVLLADDRSQMWSSGDLIAVNEAESLGSQSDNGSGTTFVVSRVPARLLAPGDYRVAVSGRSSNSAFEDIATYSFRVVR